MSHTSVILLGAISGYLLIGLFLFVKYSVDIFNAVSKLKYYTYSETAKDLYTAYERMLLKEKHALRVILYRERRKRCFIWPCIVFTQRKARQDEINKLLKLVLGEEYAKH